MRSRSWTLLATLVLALAAGAPSAARSEDSQGHWIYLGEGLPASSPAFSYDSIRRRVVSYPCIDTAGHYNTPYTTVISLGSPTTFQIMNTVGEPPGAVAGMRGVYDPIRDRMVVIHSGYVVWELSFATDPPAWQRIYPTGPTPNGRSDFTAVYDPTYDRVLMFGGKDNVSNPPSGRSYEVWALSLTGTPAWTNITPVVAPPWPYSIGVSEHQVVYDPLRHRMVSYGGANSTTPHIHDLAEVQALSSPDPGSWSELNAYAQTARAGHGLVYDSTRDRMVAFGGHDPYYGFLNGGVTGIDLETGAAAALAPTGTPPSNRYGMVSAYDPALDAMLIYGGSGQSDIWLLQWEAPTTSIETAAGVALSVHTAPRIADSHGLQVRCGFPRAGRARLDLLDVTGRRIDSVEFEVGGPGTRTVALTGAPQLGSGVAFLSLRQNGDRATARVITLR